MLRFDFRGSGESEGRGNLLTNRILDLKSAIRFVKDRGFGSIGVLGSSYGGSTAILVAGDMPELRALAVWSTPCQLVELFRSIEEPESNVSVAQTQNSRKAVRPSGFMRDLQKYNVAEAVRKVNRILVVHCKEDRVVPWAQAKLIYENAGEPKHMELFEDGDHQILEPSIRKRAIDLSLQWFHRYLDAV